MSNYQTNEFDRVKQSAKLEEYAAANLERAGKAYICPACHSGEGPKKTPAFSTKGERWKCFSCGAGGDVFDLAGVIHHTEDKREQLQHVAAWKGISLEPMSADQNRAYGWDDTFPTGEPDKAAQPATAPHSTADTERAQLEAATADKAVGKLAHAAYIKECSDTMGTDEGKPGREYLNARGYSDEAIARLGIGYDPRVRRVVFPFSSATDTYYHVDRTIDEVGKAKSYSKPTNPGEPVSSRRTWTSGHKYEKPIADEVGKQPVFNAAAITNAEILFVVEGITDSFAVMESGHQATALFSTGNNATIDAMKQRGNHGAIILMLDPDGPGRKAAGELAADLEGAGVAVFDYYATEGAGELDPADAFQADREKFAAMLAAAANQAKAYIDQHAAEAYNEALKQLHAIDPATTAQAIYLGEGIKRPIPTGLNGLDTALGGGLRRGQLAALGAISSLGKTTLMVQIADHIAANGTPVLFVTIEQSARELVSKSLARLLNDGTSAGDLTDPDALNAWSLEQFQRFEHVCNLYSSTIAPNMRICEGDERPGVAEVRAIAEAMRGRYGVSPVVIIDYLQLLAAIDEKDTDKRITDRNITALRRLARDLDAAVVAISSLNRASYSSGISMESFKESGAIEYGTDVLLGLQPHNFVKRIKAGEPADRADRAEQIIYSTKRADRRKLEIVTLKLRNGRMPDGNVPITFDARAGLFTDGVEKSEHLSKRKAKKILDESMKQWEQL